MHNVGTDGTDDSATLGGNLQHTNYSEQKLPAFCSICTVLDGVSDVFVIHKSGGTTCVKYVCNDNRRWQQGAAR